MGRRSTAVHLYAHEIPYYINHYFLPAKSLFSWEGIVIYGPRGVKKLMRPRARSISRAHQAVRDTESGLHALCLGSVQERGGHSPSLDGFSRDDNGPCIHGGRAGETPHQRASAVRDIHPSPSGPIAPRRRSDSVIELAKGPASPRSPNLNAYAERWVRSVKDE